MCLLNMCKVSLIMFNFPLSFTYFSKNRFFLLVDLLEFFFQIKGWGGGGGAKKKKKF